jgi:hypothetical protein
VHRIMPQTKPPSPNPRASPRTPVGPTSRKDAGTREPRGHAPQPRRASRAADPEQRLAQRDAALARAPQAPGAGDAPDLLRAHLAGPEGAAREPPLRPSSPYFRGGDAGHRHLHARRIRGGWLNSACARRRRSRTRRPLRPASCSPRLRPSQTKGGRGAVPGLRMARGPLI